MRSRRRHEDEAFEINLVPMIDCMLILLIFFMVATTLKHMDKELPLDLPTANASLTVQTEDDLLVLGMDAKGTKYIGTNPVGTEELHRQLAQAGSAEVKRRVRVDADSAARYEDVIELVELCQFHGLRNVGLHTRDGKERR